MNSETGDIENFPSEQEAKKKGFDVPLSPADAEILEDVDPDQRVKIWQNWKDYEADKKFNSNIERIKAKQAFLQGCVVGIHL